MFTKHLERIKQFKETQFKLYKNELDRTCFAHDIAYTDGKDLAKGTILDKILVDRAYENALNS